MIKRVGILGHPLRPETEYICVAAAEIFRAHGIEVWMRAVWAPADVRDLIAQSDMVVAIGGDGAMLRAARLCATAEVPVLGINAGYLGFITEADPKDLPTILDLVLADKYWVEQRLMIRAELWRKGQKLNGDDALNDVVIGRGAAFKLVRLDAYIDGYWATTYHADGLIIASPTGSTAYALAAGGPILPPELNNILLVPIAAHFTLDRPLVLSEGAVIEVVVRDSASAQPVFSIDGETIASLQPDDSIVIQASQLRSRFVRTREKSYFYRSILDRMEPRQQDRPEVLDRSLKIQSIHAKRD